MISTHHVFLRVRNVKRSSPESFRCCRSSRSGSTLIADSKPDGGKRSNQLLPIWLLRLNHDARSKENRREQVTRFSPHGSNHRHWQSSSHGPSGSTPTDRTDVSRSSLLATTAAPFRA